MAINNYEYIDDMETDNTILDHTRQKLFVENICEQLKLSEWDGEIIYANLYVLLGSDKNNYNPKVNKYIKDEGQIYEIFNNYGIKPTVQNKALSIMEKEAEENNCETLYDLFICGKADKDTWEYLSELIGNNDFSDICLDIYEVAQGTATLNKHDDLEINIVDQAIMACISERFNLGSKTDDMLPIIQLRKQKGVSKMEVAYRIADKYNLPGNAENSIVKIINENEDYEREYLIAKNSR